MHLCLMRHVNLSGEGRNITILPEHFYLYLKDYDNSVGNEKLHLSVKYFYAIFFYFYALQ